MTEPRRSKAKVAAKAATTRAKPASRRPAKKSTRDTGTRKRQPTRPDPATVLPPHAFAGETAGAKCPRCGRGKRAKIHTAPSPDLGAPAADAQLDQPRKPGDLERAFRTELELLHIDATALGASAVALARMADQSGSATTVVELLREARMQLTTARGLGAPPAGNGTQPTGPGEVVAETRLQRLRRERDARQAATG